MYDTDKLKDPETIRKYTNTLKLQEECDEEKTANKQWKLGM